MTGQTTLFRYCAALAFAAAVSSPVMAEPLTRRELQREAVTLRSSAGEAVLLLGEVLWRRAPATLAVVQADETAALLKETLKTLAHPATAECERSRHALLLAAEGARDAFVRLGRLPDRPGEAPALRDEFGRLRDAVLRVRPCEG